MSMMMAFRRLLAGCAAAAALVIGLSPVMAQAAPTPTPTPRSSASASASAKATAQPSDDAEPDISGAPDTTPDNSRMIWILSGAGVVAIAAAAVVIARH
jgi:hypothetical protein